MKTRDGLGKRVGLVVFLAMPLAIVVFLLFAIAGSVSKEAETLGPGAPPPMAANGTDPAGESDSD